MNRAAACCARSSPKDLIEVATSGGGVRQRKADYLLGVNDEDGTDLDIADADVVSGTLVSGSRVFHLPPNQHEAEVEHLQ